MWHSIDPRGDFWLICARLASGVLVAVLATKYWMFMIPVAVLASLVGTAEWYMRQPPAPTAKLARAVDRRN